MEGVKLSDMELRYFSDLFNACDVENAGKVSGIKAAELFRASQLSPETLQQISDLCGAKRLGHFGRSQFYVALKLIAAAQLGLPLKLDTFQAGMDIPLPKFTRVNDVGSEKSWLVRQQSGAYQQYAGDSNLINLQERQENCNQLPGHLPPPPAKSQPRNSSNSLNNQRLGVGSLGGAGSPPAVTETQNPIPVASLARTESSPPTNISGSDKDWAAYVGRQHALQDGHQWQLFDDEKQLLTTEDENSERHSSDEEYDIWSITEEQREYYINQFRLLQPDLSGLISGSVAKEFFEKSKLPVQELSKIWQLSDVNKDGALSLEEFFTAMHLVVLRRNNIDLPDTLPSALIPQMGKQISDAVAFNDGGSKVVSSPPRSPPEPASPHGKEDPKILHPVAVRLSPESQVISSDENDTTKIRSAADPIPYEPLQEQQKSPGKWPNAVSGTGANLAVTDASGEVKLGPPPQAAIQRPVAKKTSLPGPGALPPPPQPGQVVSPTSDDAVDGNFIFPVSSFSGSSSAMSASYHMGMTAPQGPKKEPPPPPPPRPKRNHARSSSLDLNRLGAPPAVPPRISPGTTTPKKLVGQKSESDVGTSVTNENSNFANFSQFASTETPSTENAGDVLQLKAGAFEVYKRPLDSTSSGPSTVMQNTSGRGAESAIMKEDSVPLVDFNSNEEGVKDMWPQETPDAHSTAIQPSSKPKDKKELQAAIRVHRERNMVLSRLNSELNQELSEVMEERIALEIQLEHMKPYSN